MNTASNSQGKILSLSRSYQTALAKYLLRSPESKTGTARNLGNRAVKLRIDLLGLARIHEDALGALERKDLALEEIEEGFLRSTVFFNSAAGPIEESRFTASEAGHQFETLRNDRKELKRSNKQLLAKIAHREEVEKSFRNSEATTSLLLHQARKMQEEMRSLSRRLITAQEDERKRISRELHDVIAQTLAGINVRLAVLRSQSVANNEDFDEKIEITERLVEQSVEIVHRFASDLRPVVLDDIGLIPALKACINSFSEVYGIEVKSSVSRSVEELNSSALTTFYRIAQEALANIGRHSKASLVNFDIRPSRCSFGMKIADNGRGFAQPETTSKHQPKRLGILGMRERAEMVGGTFQISSTVGEGTVIQVVIPRPETAIGEPSGPKRKSSKTPPTIS